MNKVLIIYTGGTIGMLPKEKDNPLSPLVPGKWNELQEFVPALKQLPVDIVLYEMDVIDSSDMHPDYWIDIARVIRDNYDDYSGFVILHGTDTMTYTAAALSFLLENLDKPVIITGSQISISKARNDAVQNLVSSIMLSAPKSFGLPVIPEVCVFFNNKLFRGNRTRKISSSAYEGFDTPNYNVLAEAGGHIKVNERFIREPSKEGFFIHENLEKNVMLVEIFPGITAKALRNIFNLPELKGIVLKTYGAGNAPTDQKFIREIEDVVKWGLMIVNITQCLHGMVNMERYEAGAELSRRGVISGADMTPEAALVKMMFLLGQGYDIETTKDEMQKDLRGELTEIL